MRIIWVDGTNGSDYTGSGSQSLPYKTLEKAISVMQSGDQIRILDGTYITTDSIVISGLEGSIFAENFGSVYIQPQKTTKHQGGLVILDSGRFSIYGVNVLQAADASSNVIGIYVENVENFLAYTCTVDGFDLPSGVGCGIFASGMKGRVENCKVSNFTSLGGVVYGIRTKGLHVIDCEVSSISGVNSCEVIGIDQT